MELFFLAFLFVTMAFALGSGYPVAFSLPGAAIISIAAAALFGYLIESDSAAYFHSGSPYPVSYTHLTLPTIYSV